MQFRIEALNSLKDVGLVIVGAGLFGLTIAERASSWGINSLVVERRPHIGGNAFSSVEPGTNIEVHRYGSHLFHTSNREIWEYVNKFTEFNSYQHTVWTRYRGAVYSLPVNLNTINQIYGSDFDPQSAKARIEKDIPKALMGSVPRNFEEMAISRVGLKIYETLIRGYSLKQWQTDLKEIPASVIKRLPVRFNFNNRYFSDNWEGLPLGGYSAWFDKMVHSNRIQILTNTDYFDIAPELKKNTLVIFSGPIDGYFQHRLGRLKWRTLDFEFSTLEIPDYQGTSVMNFAEDTVPYTRVHEFKHLHPERDYLARTVIAKEYSRFAEVGDEPYYPVNSPQDRELIRRYRDLANKETNVLFGGRLGSYKYLDMHMAIGQALTMWSNKVLPILTARSVSE